MNYINAKIIADSKNKFGNRITTMQIVCDSQTLKTLLTHKELSISYTDIKEIKTADLIKSVQENPFIPIAWKKEHEVMCGSEYLEDNLSIEFVTSNWLTGRDSAVKWVEALHSNNNGYDSITKQLCNRLLEPFMWHSVIVTTTEWENFFAFRCPQYLDPSGVPYKSKKDYRKNSKWGCWEDNEDDIIGWLECNDGKSEIHMMDLAETMWDAYNESTPRLLKAGEWHIPFKKEINNGLKQQNLLDTISGYINNPIVKISIAICARISYTVVGTKRKESNYENDIKLYDKLAESKDLEHFEHCAKTMTNEEFVSFSKSIHSTKNKAFDNNAGLRQKECLIDDFVINREEMYGWHNNFRGFVQYRRVLENN